MNRNKILWLLGLGFVTLVLFILFRLYNLNAIPVFVDEAIYVRWSQVMRTEPSLRFIPLSDGKQPLFMWGTIPFLKFISDPLVAGRLVSVFAGLGSLIGVGLLALVLFADPFIAIFSSLLYAIIPFTMFFDRMALADSLLAMFGVWSLFLAVKFVKTLKIEYAMFLGFAIGGGLLTKSPATVFYVWLAVATLFFFNIKNLKSGNLWQLLWGLFLALAISQAMYSILRLGVGFQMIGARNQDYVYSLGEVLRHPLSPLWDNLVKTGNWLFLLFTPTVLLLGAIGYFNPKTRRHYLFLVLIALLPILFQAFIAKVYTSRYALYAVYPLIPLAGLGLHWLFSRKGALIKASIAIFLAVPLLITSVYLFQPYLAPMSIDMSSGYLTGWTSGQGQKDVALYLLARESEGNKIVVFTEGFFGTLPDGLQIYTEGHPNITIVGSNPVITEIPSGLLNSSADNLRYFVINKSRNMLKPEDLEKLELIKEYAKPTGLDGTPEALQFYRLK